MCLAHCSAIAAGYEPSTDVGQIEEVITLSIRVGHGGIVLRPLRRVVGLGKMLTPPLKAYFEAPTNASGLLALALGLGDSKVKLSNPMLGSSKISPE
jgi:hypothetical protein